MVKLLTMLFNTLGVAMRDNNMTKSDSKVARNDSDRVWKAQMLPVLITTMQ